MTVHANKLIAGANRPRQSTKGGSKRQVFELNLQRVCTDPEFVPARQIGPVELVTKSGEGTTGGGKLTAAAAADMHNLTACRVPTTPPCLQAAAGAQLPRKMCALEPCSLSARQLAMR